MRLRHLAASPLALIVLLVAAPASPAKPWHRPGPVEAAAAPAEETVRERGCSERKDCDEEGDGDEGAVNLPDLPIADGDGDKDDERAPERAGAPPPAPAPVAAPVPSRPAAHRPIRKALISIRSRPAADRSNTRIGTRVRAPYGGVARLVLRDGARVIGVAVAPVAPAQDLNLSVPVDAAIRDLLARTRHVELIARVELESDGAETAVIEHQATLVEPPQFLAGTRGVLRRGGFGEQRLFGTARTDRLFGDSGDDRLTGMGGNDDLHGGTGNDRVAGGSGNDHLDGYDGDDLLLGGPGDDLIIESRFGDDELDGGAGNDWIEGGRGNDEIRGSAGDDIIFGNSGVDDIDCGAGNDTVFVNLESERRTVRNCERVLDEDDIPSIPCGEGEGTEDGETMLGSSGPDVCKGHGGDDDVEGAGGHDQLFGGAGNDRIFGRFGNDLLVGEAGDDEIEGGRGNDRLDGGPGNDRLNGGYGEDVLFGGPGNDTLVSRGGGSDRLSCGPGRDVATIDRSDKTTGCETIRYR